eukprot:TRINITY_DN33943_c0_g1_i1.p1 TRINITY_DN33943_c0_g1~~TRINITY_DN33943_c0_g1_i1.p1  ORF type:complete len:332 (-),score=52.23 TRINITY_DN33943_c0_g1_i1:95-1090(-)
MSGQFQSCLSCFSCLDGLRLLFGRSSKYTLLYVAPRRGHDWRGLPQDRVCVELGPEHARKRHKADARIDDIWAAHLSKHPRSYSGSKFRLAGFRYEKDVSDAGRLILQLSITEFKESVATNGLPGSQVAELMEDGKNDHGDPWSYFANALGCDVLLETADGYVVELARSSTCGSYPGHYQGPSGHPEPSQVATLNVATKFDERNTLSACLSKLPCDRCDGPVASAVTAELFASAAEETASELMIPKESLSSPRLMGLMIDPGGKPDALFHIKTDLTSAQVIETYSSAKRAGLGETWESDRIRCLKTVREARRLPLTPCAAASLACFTGRRR